MQPLSYAVLYEIDRVKSVGKSSMIRDDLSVIIDDDASQGGGSVTTY